jgi:hypothetical protein
MDRSFPSCMGGCGKYPYVDQWHLWNGGYCNSCWQSQLAHLEEMKQIREDHEWRMQEDEKANRRFNLFLFIVFGSLLAALFIRDLVI